MTDKKEPAKSKQPPPLPEDDYASAFNRSAWKGTYCVSCLTGACAGLAIGTGRLLLRGLVRLGGFLFGMLVALGCLIGIGYVVSLIIKKGN